MQVAHQASSLNTYTLERSDAMVSVFCVRVQEGTDSRPKALYGPLAYNNKDAILCPETGEIVLDSPHLVHHSGARAMACDIAALFEEAAVVIACVQEDGVEMVANGCHLVPLPLAKTALTGLLSAYGKLFSAGTPEEVYMFSLCNILSSIIHKGTRLGATHLCVVRPMLESEEDLEKHGLSL